MRFLFLVITLLMTAPIGRSAEAVDDPIQQMQAKLSSLPPGGKLKQRVHLHMELGLLHYRQGNWAAAAEELEGALQNDPTRAQERRIYLYLGKSYESHERLDKAIAAYEMAAALDPNNWRRHRDLAQLYEQTHLYRSAVTSYQRARKGREKGTGLHVSIGRTWRKLGLLRYAETELATALANGERGAEVLWELSFVYEGQGRFEESANVLRKALDANSSIADWGRLVYLAAVAGNKPLALDALASLKRKGPPQESLHFYEEMVELISEKPVQILAKDIDDPNLRSLVDALYKKNQ